MTQYGTETKTYETEHGNAQHKVDVIESLKDFKVFSTYKRITVRIKVRTKQDETTQYLLWSDMIDLARADGKLLTRDSDPATSPSFIIEYPKHDIDGAYYVIRSHTEIVN